MSMRGLNPVLFLLAIYLLIYFSELLQFNSVTVYLVLNLLFLVLFLQVLQNQFVVFVFG